MELFQERTDGLLRGSREERVRAMEGLAKEQWDIWTILDLHVGSLDHAWEVRGAALEALIAQAESRPEPVGLSPVALLGCLLSPYLGDTGAEIIGWRLLFELRTDEADEVCRRRLIDVAGGMRLKDFEHIINLMLDCGRRDMLVELREAPIGKRKAATLHRLLEAAEGDPDSAPQ